MGKESGICIPSAYETTELSCKSGKQGTFMYQDIYQRINYVSNLVKQGTFTLRIDSGGTAAGVYAYQLLRTGSPSGSERAYRTAGRCLSVTKPT